MPSERPQSTEKTLEWVFKISTGLVIPLVIWVFKLSLAIQVDLEKIRSEISLLKNNMVIISEQVKENKKMISDNKKSTDEAITKVGTQLTEATVEIRSLKELVK